MHCILVPGCNHNVSDFSTPKFDVIQEKQHATLNENLFRATEYVDMDVIIEVARQRCEAKLSKSQLERAMQLMAETFVARSRPECGAAASSTRD